MKTASHVRLHLRWLAAGTGLAASAGPWEPNVTFAGSHGALAPERVPAVLLQEGCTSSIADAALQRYLAEAAWFPTALLPAQGVSWTMVSDTVARATLRADSIAASVDFRFGDEGLVESVFVPDRLYDDGRSEPGPQPWQGRNLSYETQHGVMVPADAVVEWLLPQRTYAYWRARPTSIEYEYGTQP